MCCVLRVIEIGLQNGSTGSDVLGMGFASRFTGERGATLRSRGAAARKESRAL